MSLLVRSMVRMLFLKGEWRYIEVMNVKQITVVRKCNVDLKG